MAECCKVYGSWAILGVVRSTIDLLMFEASNYFRGEQPEHRIYSVPGAIRGDVPLLWSEQSERKGYA